MEIWDCTFPTLNEAALRDACTLVEVSCVMHLFMEKLLGAADPERCWWSTALYWFWDQNIKMKAAGYVVQLVCMATAEITDLHHGQDTL